MALFATEKNLLHDPATRQSSYRKWVPVLIIVALMLGAYFYVGHLKEMKMQQASTLYQELMEAVKTHNTPLIKERGQSLIKNHSDSPYGQVGAFMLAKEAVDSQDLDLAAQHLSWAAKQNKAPFAPIARVRLARIYFAQDKAELALATLKDDETAYHSLFEEVQADYQSSRGDWQAARTHYQKALSALPRGIQAPWIDTKLGNLVSAEKS